MPDTGTSTESKPALLTSRRLVQCCLLAAVCVWLVGSARHAGSAAIDDEFTMNTAPRISGELTIRWALLSPDKDWKYVRRVGLPQLQSSVCLVERYLSPLWHSRFGAAPQYVIYTDNGTHRVVAGNIRSLLGDRVTILNLDIDSDDTIRLAQANLSQLDPKNVASVRRLLADAALLPPTARLLLGTDISIIREPKELIARATAMLPSQATYLADRHTLGGGLYTLRGEPSPGPQCPGLVGDFVLVGPSVNISVDSVNAALKWYKNQPVSLTRTVPPCAFCVANSGGMHAIDQFALALVLGAAVLPQGPTGCFPLSNKAVHSPGGYSFQYLEKMQDSLPGVQVAHTKVIARPHGYDFCP